MMLLVLLVLLVLLSVFYDYDNAVMVNEFKDTHAKD